MYLKAIEIFGFKSFGERVFIEFNRGLTSIVGPNGSGKSNILDAVLWVLGEQSYKTIRAKESTDVIFSGGKDKKPMNSAEVSLYIDNSDSFLPIENEEIKITRKILSSGENEYYINDSKSRLKDIGNLFLDTGVGKNAYSVIGQGKVERIIGSSAKEVKSIIEEAAGIKKFQGQKNEAIKNLSNVDLELEKINLILSEVGERKQKVEKQAGKAQEYLSLKEKRDTLSKKIHLSDLEILKKEVDNNIKLKNELSSDLVNFQNEFTSVNTRLDEIDREKKELKKYIDDIGSKNLELKKIIDDKEREKIKISERIDGYKRELTDREDRLTHSFENIKTKETYLKELRDELASFKEKIQTLESEKSKYEEEILALEKEKSDFDMKREIKKSKIRDLELERLKLINDIENSNKRVNGSSSKIKMFQEEKKEYEEKLNGILQEEKTHKLEYEEKKKTLQDVIKREEFLENEISKVSQRLNKVGELLRNSEYEEKRVTNKLQALLRLEENNEGFFKGVKEILNSKLPGVEGVFISLVDIPEKYEKAISAGIPGNIQDIVVTTSQVAKKAIEILKEKRAGRASFLALDTIKVSPKKSLNINIDGIIGYASDLVKCDKKYQIVVDFLLNNLLVVDKIDTGLQILKTNQFYGNIVTLSGELLSSRGRITGGDSGNSAASQIFERKKEIRLLNEQNTNLKNNIEKYLKENSDLSELLTKFEEEIDKIDSLENEIKKQVKLREDTLRDFEGKISRINKDIKTVDIELENELRYADEFEKKINSSNTEKEKIEFMISNLKSEEENDINENRIINEKIDKIKSTYDDKKILFLNSKDNIEQLTRTLQKEKADYDETINIQNQLKNKVEMLKNEIINLEKNLITLNDELGEIIQQYENKNTDIVSKTSLNEALGDEERNLLKKKQELDSYILHKNDHLKKISEKAEKYSLDIVKIEEDLKELEHIKVDEEIIVDIPNKRQELRNLENNLKNFQDVNILAIEEFKELNERFTFLNTQQEDLVKGKNVLLNLISDIDKTIHDRFYDAYKNIDANFNKMCMETLNNSIGSLNLTNSDNFDDCGVEIFVKFKNKKRQSLSLLSGGEKSMVAIAFIMAIFMYKPSPFTFLDEIEAALDEKNTRKLIGKLKEFNDKSQFILITHNKDTMRESDSIFGVTMNKEIGISKIVPVTF